MIVGDATAALRATGAPRPAVVVIAGTGSIAYGEDARGTQARAGGYGAVIGDDGSYAAGIAAIRHAALVLDRARAPDPLSDGIIEALRVTTSRALIDTIHKWPPDIAAIAALAPLVGDADAAGTPAARAIVDSLGVGLAVAANAVCATVRAPAALPVTLTGGAFDALPRLVQLVGASVTATGPCVTTRQTIDAALGAAFIARDSRTGNVKEQSVSSDES